MLRKNRLKCESISARLFLACHQKFNAFKCKQFCYAKPTLAHLLAGGFAPRPRERRAAVHGLCYSVGSSAHSPVNSLRSNSTVSCGLLCKPFSPLKTWSPIALGAGAMLLVFRQHRLALSATGGASATLPAFSDSLLHCGAAFAGSRGL